MKLSRDEDAPAVRVPPPLLALAAMVGGWLLERVVPLGEGFLGAIPEHGLVGAAIMGLTFLILGVWSVRLFHRLGENEIPWTTTHSLVLSGPYRFSRNPMYLQMVIMVLGAAILFANLWILLFTPVLVWALHHFAIRHEEAYLEAKFGDAYRDYRRKVRRWI